MQNPFQKQQTFTEKITDQVSKTLHIPRKPTPTEKIIMAVQKYGIYVALFLAGFILAKLHSLITI